MRGNAAEAGTSAQERSAGDIGAVPRESVVARLRAQIERVQAAPRRLLAQLSTGAPALDGLGVFQLGGAVELSGEEASGRTTVALSLVASASREKRLAAWVDGPQELYPPAAVPLGVELQRLLIVRPPGPGQLVWSAVQLLRSGAFTCVVLDVTHTGLRLSMIDTKKLLDAARAGGALLVVLTSSAAPAQGLVRLVLASRVAGHEGPLRVVGAEASDEPMVHVEVARAQQRTGRTLVVPRAVLGPRVRSRRSARVLVPGLTVPSVSAVSSLERPRAYEQRDGRGLYVVTRPGREGRLGPLVDASRPQGAPAGPRRHPAAKLAGLEAVRTGPAAATTRVQVRSFR